jgi:prepilin-type N-terminal cleavage/methylation domain-containing protein
MFRVIYSHIRFFLFFDNTFMRKNTSLWAFTLGELLVVMTIIGILAVWISNTNFSRLSQKQQVSIEAVKIINLIETARDSALIWRWVGVNLLTPESWSIEIDNSASSGSLVSRYLSGSLSYTGSTWASPLPFSISNLECRSLNDSLNTASWSFIIRFTWSQWEVTNCNDKKINFDYGIGTLTQNITINTLSGVIEID